MKILALILLFCTLPQDAWAHVDGAGYGFMAGLMHPVLGLDHLLAMIAVGVVSAQMGGRAIWSVPAAFVAMMMVGGLSGLYLAEYLTIDFALMAVELGIIASVIALGLAIAMDKNIGEKWSMLFVGFFALFHGFAHGYEFPGFGLAWLYVLGFVFGTSALHIAGVLIGLSADRFKHGGTILRHTGSAVLGIGIFMAIDAIQYYAITEVID